MSFGPEGEAARRRILGRLPVTLWMWRTLPLAAFAGLRVVRRFASRNDAGGLLTSASNLKIMYTNENCACQARHLHDSVSVEEAGAMSYFKKELAKRQVSPRGRRWLLVPYDQLTDQIGPLSREDPKGLGIVLVENPWKAARRPYHKQKLALILAILRHFALEQAERGVAVKHVIAEGPYAKALETLIPELGALRVMVPAERELRVDLETLGNQGALLIIPHEGWLSTSEQLGAVLGEGYPESLEGGVLLIKFPAGYGFQAGQVTRTENAKVITEALQEVTGKDLRITARVAAEAARPAAAAEEDARILSRDELLQVLKQEFDASVIDDGPAR